MAQNGMVSTDVGSVDAQALGARIRSLRSAQGLTQSEIAGETFSAGYVSRIESGVRRPTQKVLEEIAERLGTTPDQLLNGIETSAYEELKMGLDYAELALESGEAVEAETHARGALASARTSQLPELTCRGELLLGRALEAQGRYPEAITCLEQSAEHSDGLRRVEAGIALSRCLRDSGDLSLAIEVGERIEASIAGTPCAEMDEAVQLSVTVAAAYAERGDLARATRRCTEAISVAERLASPRARASAYWNASVVEATKGRTAAAAPLASRALALLSEGRDERNLARLRHQVGRLLLQADPPDVAEAIRQTSQARAAMEHTSASAVDLALCDVTLAQAHVLTGDAETAGVMAQRCLDQAPETAALTRVEATIVLGQVAAAHGDIDRARLRYQEAVHLLTTLGADRSAGQVWYELAELLEDVEEYDAARTAFRSAAAAAGLAARRQRRRATASALT